MISHKHSNMDGATLKTHTVYTNMEPPQGRNSILLEALDSFCISKEGRENLDGIVLGK